MACLHVHGTIEPTKAPHLMSLAIIHVSPKLVWNRGGKAWANRKGAESNYDGWCDYKLSVGGEAASVHFQFSYQLLLCDELKRQLSDRK